MDRLLKYFKRIEEVIFFDDGAVFFVLMMVGASTVLFALGGVLFPIICAAVISYIMLGMKKKLETLGASSNIAFYTSYLFLIMLIVVLVGLIIPQLISQAFKLAASFPSFFARFESEVQASDGYFLSIPVEIRVQLVDEMRILVGDAGRLIATYTRSVASGVLITALYVLLIPLLVFFFMLYGREIVKYITDLLPGDHRLANHIWQEMDDKLANYIRGKFIEVVIFTVITEVLFLSFGMPYSSILAIATGLSTVVPIIGAFLVTVPVVILIYFEYGLMTPGIVLLTIYLLLHFVDAYILQPIIFSETMNINPLVIILAVLFFGGIWGFWGALLAIPLATLVKVILDSWRHGLRVEGAVDQATTTPSDTSSD